MKSSTPPPQKPSSDEVAADANAVASQKTSALRTDLDAKHRKLEAMAQSDVWASARQTLSDLASSSLEDRIAEVFLRRLRELDSASKNDFARRLGEGSESTILATTFHLPDPPRSEIQQIFQDFFKTGIRLRFETRPELIGGFELSTHGQKLTWSLSAYVDSLEKNLRELNEQKSGPESRPDDVTDSVNNPKEEPSS